MSADGNDHRDAPDAPPEAERSASESDGYAGSRPEAHGDTATAHPPFPQVLYPQTYVWYVFISALDVMFTAIVLHDPYGVEVNPVAAYVIERWDLAGASVYKFLLVVLVVLICEFIGRQRPATGRLLARLAVAVACVPVVVASMQLLGAVVE